MFDDSLPDNKPSPSIWTHVFKPLGVAIAALMAGDFQLDVAVPVEDLRPEPTYAQITFAAANDIRFCENLFDQWMTELDKVSSKKPDRDNREEVLRLYLGHLKEDARQCSNTINKILQLHVRFASLMAQQIDDTFKSQWDHDDTSKSQYNFKYDVSETTRIANDIREASRSHSTNVTNMTQNLDSLVSALEEVQVALRERPLAEKFMGWLKYLLKAVVSIVAAFCSPIVTLLSRVEPKPQYLTSAASTLQKAAAEFCRVDPEDESESLDSVILFLKNMVPREVQIAQEFNEALDIMGLESHMMPGGGVTLYGPGLAAVAGEWRDLAKQYQSMLPVDEDPASSY